MSLNLGQYAYTLTLTNGNVDYPVRVIADTPDGMLIEPDDFWPAIGTGPHAFQDDPVRIKAAVESMHKALRNRFSGFRGMEVRHTSRPTFNGAHVQIHLKMKGKTKMHRMYFTWSNTLVRKLPAEAQIAFNDVVRHVGESFPYEFEWDEAEYQGKHKDLPITLFARGASMGICKVHVDMPTHAQQVFRGTAERFVDMIIQAKAYIEART